MQARQVFTAYDRGSTAEHNWAYCPACGSGLVQPANDEAAKTCTNPGCGFVLYRNPVPIVAVLVVTSFCCADGGQELSREANGACPAGTWNFMRII